MNMMHEDINMKKGISLLLVILVFIASIITLTSCDSKDDSCFICGGSGYYQKKDCPGC